MSGITSTFRQHDWFTVLGQQARRPGSGLGLDSADCLLWPRVSVLELGASDSAPAAARGHVRSVLRGWKLAAGTVDDASLIASELTSNAVRATLALQVPEPVGLRVLGNEQRLVLEVWDAGPGLPARQAAADFETESGRGLQIVEALANRWGCRRASANVKAVWAELLLPRGAN